MNVGTLTSAVNTLAEESFSPSQVVEFANDAIARINIETEANFPYLDATVLSDYAGFPDKWQRALFIPFVVGRMKAVDASQFEYNDQYSEFMSNLQLFKMKFAVPEIYKETQEPVKFETDFSTSPWGWGN